ncbi:sensor histidine kinase [Streptomyces sp. NPDC002409]
MTSVILGGLPALAAAATVARALIRRRPSGLARPTAVCALLSLTTTATATTGPGSFWKLPEAALLLLLIAAVTRWSPVRELRVAVPLTVLAVAVWPAPLIDGGFLERTGAAAFWLLPALGAAAIGAYPRRMDLRRRAAVGEARRAQRLQLSRDLHDFVAHDVSGIVVQAQAARFVAAADPSQAVLALERIEKAGLNALETMDRTIRMLDEEEVPDASPQPPGVPQLAALVSDFTESSGTTTRLLLPPDVLESFTHAREASAVAYRIVVEALTNVRRHAPRAPRAEVRFVPVPGGVELHVTNEASRTSPGPRSDPLRRGGGGRGLPALAERAEALGGTLTAGPYEKDGWRLVVVLPLRTTRTIPAKEPK